MRLYYNERKERLNDVIITQKDEKKKKIHRHVQPVTARRFYIISQINL